jgi:hypothetical protein
MFEINSTHAFGLRLFSALTLTKLERLIFTDVKELSGEKLVQLFVPVRDQLVRARLLRRQHISIRRLGKICVLFES